MFRRRQSQNINTTVMFSNRTADFLHAPTHSFDLIVKKNADISGNANIGGNLTIGGDLHARNFYSSGNYFLNGYVLIPAGTIIMSAINTNANSAINPVIPAGWLSCDGSAVQINSYAVLFSAIGHTYDIPGDDPSVVFRLPNLKGRVAIGYDAASGDAIGVTGGTRTHTLTSEEMPRHTHGSNANGGTSGGSIGLAKITGSNTLTTADSSSNGELDLASLAALTIGETGGVNSASGYQTAPHNNMQPFIVLTYLIKY